MHPHTAIRRENFVRVLTQYAQTQVFQYRDHIRQRQNGTGIKQFEAQLTDVFFHLAIEGHGQFTFGHSFHFFHQLDIGHRGARGKVLAVSRREGFAVQVELLVTGFFTHLFNQCTMQVIFPGTHHLTDLALDPLNVEINRLGSIQADHKVTAGQHRFREIGVELDIHRLKFFVEDLLHFQAQFGVVDIPWGIGQTRNKLVIRVFAHVDLGLSALLNIQCTDGGTEQFFSG